MISDDTYKKFQQAVKKEMGKEMDDKETKEVLNGLVGYFDLLMKIHHRSEMAKKEEATAEETAKKENAINQTNQK